MIYSPKKNIEAFIEAKNQEIQSIKGKIITEKVTYEEMETAKSHLDKLKQSQIDLSKESFDELKDTLRNSHHAVNDLVQQKGLMNNEVDSKKKELQQMKDLMEELQSKGDKVEQILKETHEVKFKLEVRKERKNQEIIDLESEVSILRNQISMERDIDNDLDQGESDLKEKRSKLDKNLKDTQSDNQELKDNIKREKEKIQKIQHQLEKDQLKEQNMLYKIENQEKNAQNHQQKIDVAQNFLQKYAEEKLCFLDETEIQTNVSQILKVNTQYKQAKEKQISECEAEIEGLEQKIHEGKMKKQKMEKEQEEKVNSLKELKEKSVELKNILNSIFQEDSNVMKLISDKKVYPTEGKENVEVKTKQESNLKGDIMDLINTSDNFLVSEVTK